MKFINIRFQVKQAAGKVKYRYNIFICFVKLAFYIGDCWQMFQILANLTQKAKARQEKKLYDRKVF